MELAKVTSNLILAQSKIELCPKDMVSGEALVLIHHSIEDLQDIESSMRFPSNSRYTVSWKKWYKPMPDKVFHRWDTAFTFAILQFSLLYCDFRVQLTESAPDGEAVEYAITFKDEACITIR